MRPFVEISDVSLSYPGAGVGATLALDGASLSIAQGEFAAIVGPSGCGKSTLLKLVSGLYPPTRGGIIVAGHEVTGPIGIVGMAFQNPIMLPWRTTLDNVLLPVEMVKPHAGRFRAHRASMSRRRGRCWRRSGSRASPIAILGNCPAACSSARPCAAL